MKKNTRDYPKRQNFDEGGDVGGGEGGGGTGRPRFVPDEATGDVRQTGGFAVEQGTSPEDQAGGGATWATKAQRAKARSRIARGFVP